MAMWDFEKLRKKTLLTDHVFFKGHQKHRYFFSWPKQYVPSIFYITNAAKTSSNFYMGSDSRSLKKGQGATPKKGNFNARQPMSKGQPLDAATHVKKQKNMCQGQITIHNKFNSIYCAY